MTKGKKKLAATTARRLSPLKQAKRAKRKKSGDDLFHQLVKLTGIPGKTIRTELSGILEKKGLDLDTLTLEQLRGVVASYLREIMSGLLEKTTPRRSDLH